MARLRSMAIVALAPLIACSLVVDTQGLSGGAQTDGGGAEGATPGPPPAPPPVSEGGGDDAGSDADAFSFDAGDAPCSFCDDFDKTALGASWTDKNENRGALSLSNDALSPPNSLLAQLTGGAGNQTGDISLRRDIATTEKRVRCEVDMKIVASLGTTGEIDLFEIFTYAADPKSYEVYIAHSDDKWQIAEYGTYQDSGTIDRIQPLSTAPNGGSWVHVTFSTDGSTASIAFDGVTAGTLGGLTNVTGTKMHFGVGLPYVSKDAPAGASVLFDNVACYVAP
jgi:hypothetical protein